jgi:hypothetical protein
MKKFTKKSEAIKQLFTILDECSFATISYYLTTKFNSAYIPAVTDDEKDDAEDWGLKEEFISQTLPNVAKGISEVCAFHPD